MYFIYSWKQLFSFNNIMCQCGQKMQFLNLQSRWKTANLTGSWLSTKTACHFSFFIYLFCSSCSVCQASPHFDLVWRPCCQAVQWYYISYMGEHVYQASSTISAPSFLQESCCQRSSDWRLWDPACRDQERRLIFFAILRCKDTVASVFLGYQFRSHEHCTVVGPCNEDGSNIVYILHRSSLESGEQ